MKPWLSVLCAGLFLSPCTTLPAAAQDSTAASTSSMSNAWLELLTRAAAHAKAHGAVMPMLSPNDHTVVLEAFLLPGEPLPAETQQVPVQQLHSMGIRVVPWTTNDPERMRAVIRTGVDGLISDRPDLLRQVVDEERAAHPGDTRLKSFVISAHRGGRGLRPENTLPSFESGLDQLATEMETDTGVSVDGVSLIWHDQFYNPQSCRHSDGSTYTMENRTWLRDLSLADAQKTFICDKLHFGPEQRNDLALSPVAVAFAAQEKMPSPYSPTYVAQLFRFARFYAGYYINGSGKSHPHAAERAANARTVRFNLETKLFPDDRPDNVKKLSEPGVPVEQIQNHTRGPQAFVDALAGIIAREHMENRCAIQSFDFRTLALVEEQYPTIPTIYLTAQPELLRSAFVPANLRLP